MGDVRANAIACLLLCGSTFTPAAVSGQTAAPARQTYKVARAASPISVDGVLDEPAWQSATRVPLPYEWFPGDNVPAAERTDCYITYDEEKLYVAFRAHDSRPDQIRGRLADRDTPFLDDTVGFMLDPFNDERRAFQFRINPLGVQMEATNNDVDGNEDWSWDAIWESHGRITAEGYIVEVAVPFAQLRFPRQDVQTWGFIAMRDIPRSHRRRLRSNYTDRNRTCLVCQFDKLTGFSGIRPGRQVELDPTSTTARTDARPSPGAALEHGDIKPQAGISGRWSITPNVIMNATVNPDFYQVEADAAQLDVNNRFALYFPEKRPFFLEGADFFSTPIDAVFTRSVADPVWGAKVTGKEGPNAFGAFVAQDEINNLIFPANQGSRQDFVDQRLLSGALRVRRDVGRGSTIGLLYTGRSGTGYENHLAGVDALVRFSASDSLEFQATGSLTEYPDDVAARNGQPGGRFGGGAGVVTYRHGTREWFWTARAGMLSPEFRADSGFVTRVDSRHGLLQGGRVHWGNPGQWFTRLEFAAAIDFAYDYAGRLTDRGMDFPIEYLGPWQIEVSYNPSPNLEYFDGVTYQNFRHNIGFGARPNRNVALFLNGTIGETIDFVNARQADTVRLSPELEFHLGRRIEGTVDHSYQVLDVEGGRLFTANLTQLRTLVHVNLRSFVRAILQYTDIDRDPALYLQPTPPETKRLFSQYLFSYKLNPQTVLLVGYSDTRDGGRQVDLTQTNRTFFMKIGYAWIM